MKNKIQQLRDGSKELILLIQEIREEFAQKGERVTSEIYSIEANLSALSEEIEDLVLRPLCNRPGLRGGIDEK